MFCVKCGNEVNEGSFCSKCGTQAIAGSQPQYTYGPAVKTPAAHYAPGSYVQRLHEFAGSTLFMVGIILFSAGNVFSIFTAFSWTSIFTMMILALPVTGFWLIFAAAKAPKKPEKVMPALTLFKISIIIDLVASCLGGLLLLIISIALFVAGNAMSGSYMFSGGASGGVIMFLGFILLLVTGGVVTVAVLYFKSALQTIGGISYNILHNTFQPLPGIKLFTILTYISLGISALGALSSLIISVASSSIMNSVLYALPSELRSVAGSFVSGGGGAAMSTMFTLSGIAGAVICVVTLNMFNNSLTPAEPGGYA